MRRHIAKERNSQLHGCENLKRVRKKKNRGVYRELNSDRPAWFQSTDYAGLLAAVMQYCNTLHF